jgi:two-component system chemotaxis response regulator CheB
MSVRVLIVDDSAFFRKRVTDILSSVPSIEVIGTASNGLEAVEKAKSLAPDVITMDYEMPVMDGLTAVRRIMAESPSAILMFSSLTYEGARVTLDALEAGAMDFLPKNFEDIARDASKMQDVLKSRILAISKSSPRRSQLRRKMIPSSHANERREQPAKLGRSAANLSPSSASRLATRSSLESPQAKSIKPIHRTRAHLRKPAGCDIVAIGTSTGGPVALQKVISTLPANFPVPILLIQHMPATFTPAFAERLDGLSALRVKQADDGEDVLPGNVYLAPGGKQMLINDRAGRKRIMIHEGDERLTYKPSVDVTFGSVAKSFAGKALAIVLTGMGADGREGSRLLKSSGSRVWTQTEATCVVYGMPQAVDKAGYSDERLDIDEFSERIINEFS